jgi:outer membrane protein assembly factor BamB/orotate phosphoribosyltransferase
MKYFRLIQSGVDVAPLIEEVRTQERTWLLNTSRQEKIAVQRDTNTIFLCAPVRRPDLHVNENQESCFTDVSNAFPRAVSFITAFAKEMNCKLSRASIVRLKSQSKVFRHTDAGAYYLIRDRYHLVIRSSSGSIMKSGDEEVRMQEGELWWFDNKQHHEAYNESSEWRIHYIFDLLPNAYEHLAVNPIPPKTECETAAGETVLTCHSRDLLLKSIRDHAVLKSERQRLIGPNGSNNAWLIDIRRISLRPKVLDSVADLFWRVCGDKAPFQVGGMEAAAIPLVTAILLKGAQRGIPVNGFIVRKERKTYGAGDLIEGILNETPIVMIDDILNSGRSLEKARAVLEQKRRVIALVFVLIDYQSKMGKAWRTKNGIEVRALFVLSDMDLSIHEPSQPPPSAIFRDVWKFEAPDPNFFHRVPKSFPVNDGDRVCFGSDSGIFWCLDARSGTVLWTFKVNARGHKNIWSSPAIHNGRVFFGSYDGNVYCLDVKTGAEIWRFIGADWVGSSPALAPDLGLLFVGLEFAVEGKRGSIVALSIESGEKIWEHITKRYVHASPAYWPERGLLACGSNDNEMLLFDAKTGVVRWRFETSTEQGEKGSIRHAPAFDAKRDHIVTGCANGYIYIIDAGTGREVWSVRTDNTVYTIPLVLGDTAFVGSTDKYLYVLDLDHQKIKKKIYTNSKVFGPPRLLAGRIYFGACNGMLYQLDPDTAEVTGTYQLPDAVTNALSYNDATGSFYALTYVNQLFALQLK